MAKESGGEMPASWLNNGVAGPQCSLLACPINVNGSHWTLFFVDFHKRTIEYYDSFCTYGNQAEIKKTLEETAKNLSQVNPELPPFSYSCKVKQRIQNDTYQCGVWTLYFWHLRLTHPEVDINDIPLELAPSIISKYREYLQKLLLSKE